MRKLKLKYYVICFCGLMICLNPNAQKQEVSKSASRGKSTSQLSEIIDSARITLDADASKSFDYVEDALTRSIESGDKTSEAISYQLLGKINANLMQYDLAIGYYLRALDILNKTGNQKEIFNTVWLLAESYKQTGEYESSLSQFDNYLNYVTKQNNTDEIIKTQGRIAEIKQLLGKKKDAENIYKNIVDKELERSNAAGAIAAQNKLADFYADINEDEKALAVYDQSVDMALESNVEISQLNTLQKKSKVLRKEKKYDEELQTRQKALEITTESNDIPAQAAENIEIANIYLEKKEPQSALPYVQRSLELTEKTGDIEKKGEALKTLSTVYKQSKDYDKALLSYQQYVETMDEIYRKRESEILSNLNITTSLNRKLQRLDLIERELDLSQKNVQLLQQAQMVNRKELKAQRILTYSLLTALIVMSVASYLVYRSGMAKRKANQMLALKSLRSQMNPHFIYNSLNSVNSYISRSDEKAANKYLSEFSHLMRSVMENSKHDFVTLKSEIDIIKIYLNLEHSRFRDKFDYTFSIHPNLETESYEIPPMLIQPFIENAVWHGLRYREDKGILDVKIALKNKCIEAIIEDNGIGRDKSYQLKTKYQKEHVSTGLKNIENRTKIINDLYNLKLDVKVEDLDRKTKTGTRVIIKLPIKNNDALS